MPVDDDCPDVEPETSFDVQLYIYDMTKGLAKMFSAMFLGEFAPRCCLFQLRR